MTLVVEGHVVDAVTAVSVVQHRYDDDAVWDMSAWEAAGDSVPWYKDLRDAFSILGKGLGNLPSMVSGHVESYIAWKEFVEKAQPTNPGWNNCDPMQIYCSTLCAGTLASGPSGNGDIIQGLVRPARSDTTAESLEPRQG